MVSKQISIKKKIYDQILKLKKKEESFSDYIESLIKRDSNFNKLKECFGISKDLPNEFEEILLQTSDDVRKSFKMRTSH